jgi:hypothetical protein
MKSRSDHVMRVPLQGCPKSECRLTCVRMQGVHWTNCALCPLLAVRCGDAGLALFTLPRLSRSYRTWRTVSHSPHIYISSCVITPTAPLRQSEQTVYRTFFFFVLNVQVLHLRPIATFTIYFLHARNYTGICTSLVANGLILIFIKA